MPRLHSILVAAVVGLSTPVLTHAHFINNPPPPPPDDLDGVAEEVLNVVSGFYTAVAGLESGTRTDIQGEFRQLSKRLVAAADKYKRYVETLETETPIQHQMLPRGLLGMAERTFSGTAGGFNLEMPSNNVDVFEQAARVLRALSEVFLMRSDRMTSEPELDGIQQFTVLNSAVLEAVHIMALHSALLWTTQK